MLSVSKILDYGIGSLAALRQKVLILLCYTLIIACVLVLPIRIIQQDFSLVAGNLVILGLTCILLYSTKKRVHELTYLVITTLMLAAITILTYAGEYSLYGGILFIVLANFSTLFFLDRGIYKGFYFLLGSSSLLLILHQYSIPLSDIFVAFFLHYGFFYLFSALMSRLEEELKNENLLKEELIAKLQLKNEEIQLYNNIMAHDIKAPLRSIKGFSSLIQRRLKGKIAQEEHLEEYFNFINTGITSLEQLIGDLLQKSNIESADLVMESIDLGVLIEEVFMKYRFYIEEKEVEVEVNLLGVIHGDRSQLSILFSNLISNAIKYQPIRSEHTPRLLITHEHRASRDVITISDNGIGIEKEFLTSIFEPFRRLHAASDYEGTGLGLNICKSIVEKHGGEIEVKSEINSGTVFTISLPGKLTPKSLVTELMEAS